MEHPSLWYVKTNGTFKTTKLVLKRKFFKKHLINKEVEEKIEYILCRHGDNYYKTSNNPHENEGVGIGGYWNKITENEFFTLMGKRVNY